MSTESRGRGTTDQFCGRRGTIWRADRSTRTGCRFTSSTTSSGVRRSTSYHAPRRMRSEEHTSELQSHSDLVCRLLLEKKKSNMNLMTALAGMATLAIEKARLVQRLRIAEEQMRGAETYLKGCEEKHRFADIIGEAQAM